MMEELNAEPIVEEAKVSATCHLHRLKQCKVYAWHPLSMQRNKSQEMENSKIIIFFTSKGNGSDYNSYRSTPRTSILDLAFVILLRLQKLAMCLYSESHSCNRLETSIVGMIFFLWQFQKKWISSMTSFDNWRHLIWTWSSDRGILISF